MCDEERKLNVWPFFCAIFLLLIDLSASFYDHNGSSCVKGSLLEKSVVADSFSIF